MLVRAYWIIGLLLLSGAGLAAGSPPETAAQQRARELFDSAETHYRLGRFQDALSAYSQAYEALPLPAFLFNIGQCHRQLGNHERAVFFFQTFLREQPAAPNRAIVEDLIGQSRAALESEAAERRRLEEERLRLEEKRLALEAGRKQEEARRLELERARLAALQPPPPAIPESPPLYSRWWFWTLIGAAAAGAAVGVALAVGGSEQTVLPGGSLGTIDLRGQP